MLFVTLKEPYKSVQKATMAGWLSKVIILSGQKGTPGSIGSGALSSAIMRGVDPAMVMGAGAWTSVCVFKTHYFKSGPLYFAKRVLS